MLAYQALRAAGLDELRRRVPLVVPWLAGRMDTLQDWNQSTVLAVEVSRLRRWYRPGLLLLGDATHTMSPVAGVGISLAIQDAAVAANVLAPRLRTRRVGVSDLAAVQRRREWAVRLLQAYQGLAQRWLLATQRDQEARIPLMLRVQARVPLRHRMGAQGTDDARKRALTSGLGIGRARPLPARRVPASLGQRRPVWSSPSWSQSPSRRASAAGRRGPAGFPESKGRPLLEDSNSDRFLQSGCKLVLVGSRELQDGSELELAADDSGDGEESGCRRRSGCRAACRSRAVDTRASCRPVELLLKQMLDWRVNFGDQTTSFLALVSRERRVTRSSPS
jgi:hypothetical protein